MADQLAEVSTDARVQVGGDRRGVVKRDAHAHAVAAAKRLEHGGNVRKRAHRRLEAFSGAVDHAGVHTHTGHDRETGLLRATVRVGKLRAAEIDHASLPAQRATHGRFKRQRNAEVTRQHVAGARRHNRHWHLRPGHRERHHAHCAVAAGSDKQIGAVFQRARGLRVTGVLRGSRKPGDFRAGPDAALHGTTQAAEVDLYRVIHHRDVLGTCDSHQLMVTACQAWGATRSPRRRSPTAFGWQTRQRRALRYRRYLRARRAGRRRCGNAPVLRRSRPT